MDLCLFHSWCLIVTTCMLLFTSQFFCLWSLSYVVWSYCTWHCDAISHPAVNGFVSLLSGISPEKCVYAHLRLYKLFSFNRHYYGSLFWNCTVKKCPLLRFGWRENVWLKKLRDQYDSPAGWWGCRFIVFPKSRKTKEMQRFVSRSGACVPVPSPAASLMTRWVLNSVTQLLWMGRLGPASYILLKCCAVSELLYRIKIKKSTACFQNPGQNYFPPKFLSAWIFASFLGLM